MRSGFRSTRTSSAAVRKPTNGFRLRAGRRWICRDSGSTAQDASSAALGRDTHADDVIAQRRDSQDRRPSLNFNPVGQRLGIGYGIKNQRRRRCGLGVKSDGATTAGSAKHNTISRDTREHIA